MKFIALIVSILTGYVVQHYLLGGAPAAYASILISYHLLLAFLVASMDWSEGFSVPLQPAIAIHSLFLAFLVGFAAAGNNIPAFGLLSLLVPALAFLEVEWVFRTAGKKEVSKVAPVLPNYATREDYGEFLVYLKQDDRPFSQPGRSVKEEYGYWLANRKRAGSGMKSGQPSAH